MSPDLQRLIRLQDLDAAIEAAKRTIAAHPERVAALESRLSEARAAVDAAAARLKENHDARRALEKDQALYAGRLSKFKDQLSAVKTNREYTAMQHEIETAKQDLDAVDEKMLERMMEADAMAADVKAAEAVLAARTKEVQAETAALEAELAAVNAKLKEATEARAALVREMDPRIITLFEQVAKMRKGVGVAVATRDGLCSICHVRLRPQVFQKIRQNDEIVQCDSCQRIMYFIPPPAAPTPATVVGS